METQKENLNIDGTKERQEITFKKTAKGIKPGVYREYQKEMRKIKGKNKIQGQQTNIDLRNVIGEGTNERQEMTKIDIEGRKFKHRKNILKASVLSKIKGKN